MGALWLDNAADIAWLPGMQEVVVWLSGLGARRWRLWLMAAARGDAIIVATQGKVEVQGGSLARWGSARTHGPAQRRGPEAGARCGRRQGRVVFTALGGKVAC